jgi:hypothetical protein
MELISNNVFLQIETLEQQAKRAVAEVLFFTRKNALAIRLGVEFHALIHVSLSANSFDFVGDMVIVKDYFLNQAYIYNGERFLFIGVDSVELSYRFGTSPTLVAA